MGGLSLVHWVIILAVVLIFFGAGRLSNVMGEFAKGIKAFRAGMKEDDPPPPVPLSQSTPQQPIPDPMSAADRKVV